MKIELDQNYVPPPGFKPLLGYNRDSSRGPIRHVAVVEKTINHPRLLFWAEKQNPTLPLIRGGEHYSVRWDGHTSWAIDANRQCWSDEQSPTGYLTPVSQEQLLELLCPEEDLVERESNRNHIRDLLGMPALDPQWMQQARAAGWTPPNNEEK